MKPYLFLCKFFSLDRAVKSGNQIPKVKCRRLKSGTRASFDSYLIENHTRMGNIGEQY